MQLSRCAGRATRTEQPLTIPCRIPALQHPATSTHPLSMGMAVVVPEALLVSLSKEHGETPALS